MRRRISCVVIVLFSSLIFTECTVKSTDESVEPSEIVEETETMKDTIIEEIVEAEEEKDASGETIDAVVERNIPGFPGEDLEIMDSSDTSEEKQVPDEINETDDFVESMEKENQEEFEEAEQLQEKTYGIDLVEPSENCSAIDY